MATTSRTIATNVAVFIILEVASLCFLGFNSRMQQMWLVRGAHVLMADIWSGSSNLRHFLSLRDENERLAHENFLLQEELRKARQDSTSIPQWSDIRMNFKYLDARIVKSSRGSQHNYLVIDRGSSDGVEVNDGIITTKGAIGIIQSVTSHFAYAVSFTNQVVAISAKAGHDGPVGSLAWEGGRTDMALLGGIPLHIAVDRGDTVFTSGFSAIFPPEIPLGVIEEKAVSNGSTAEFSVNLFEDLSSVHYVTVVKNIDKKELGGMEE